MMELLWYYSQHATSSAAMALTNSLIFYDGIVLNTPEISVHLDFNMISQRVPKNDT